MYELRCPPIVDKSNWNALAAGDHKNGDEVFYVVAEDGGVTVELSNGDHWDMNLTFECCRGPPIVDTPWPTYGRVMLHFALLRATHRFVDSTSPSLYN